MSLPQPDPPTWTRQTSADDRASFARKNSYAVVNREKASSVKESNHSSYNFSYTGNYSHYKGYAKYLHDIRRNAFNFIKS